ncbi:hypothetical protein LGM46_34340 [Burkholderia arboris]|uniref:hypothetical protein n=1 Tax=Burkholderia arboris TaxID=488730 RepID=UPI001CF1F6FF|nr:hypothetical protein [Burkholderia arboris]MCA8038054.1 hypothetical protein [Burkholderia arboris]
MRLIKILIVSVLLSAVAYVFFARVLIHIPMDTVEKYRQMRSDMNGILGQGGLVIFSKESERGSAALIMVSVDSRSVDEKLLAAYRDTFASQEWRVIDSSSQKISYCKEGVLATLNLVPEWFPGKRMSVYGLTMEYNSGATADCKQ